jgi:DNA-binding CsgD family transcriptional regulator
MPKTGDLSSLKPREVEVVTLVAAGLNNNEIAAELGISHRTVETHRIAAINTLKLGNTAELVLYVLTGRRRADALPAALNFVRRGPQATGARAVDPETSGQYNPRYFARKHGISTPEARALLRHAGDSRTEANELAARFRRSLSFADA